MNNKKIPVYFKAISQHLSGRTKEIPVKKPVVCGSKFESRTSQMQRMLFL
jgi:hypothetical protein